MIRRSLGTLVFALTASLASCESVAPESIELREGPDVLPFIPVCTACMAWSFAGQRWALHRPPATSIGADETEEVDAANAPLELLAVRFQSDGPWWHTDEAESFQLGAFEIYTWPGRQLDAEPPTDALEPIDEPDSDKPLRTADLLVVQNDVTGVCVVPWLGGGPLPGEKALIELVDVLDIERQGCPDVM